MPVYTQEKGPLSGKDCHDLQQDLNAAFDFASQYPTVELAPVELEAGRGMGARAGHPLRRHDAPDRSVRPEEAELAHVRRHVTELRSSPA